MENSDRTGPLLDALRGLQPGQSCLLAPPPGEAMRAFHMRVCYRAHRLFGKGRYRAATVDGGVRITRLDAAPPAPEPDPVPRSAPEPVPLADPPVPANAPDDQLLTRAQAAQFLAPWFPQGITSAQLRAFCNAGTGPSGVRNGRYVLHSVGELRRWAQARLRPIQGRAA